MYHMALNSLNVSHDIKEMKGITWHHMVSNSLKVSHGIK